MPPKRSGLQSRGAASSTADSVDGFLAALDHPLKPALALVRSAILGASSQIEEGIKWNAPSFRRGEWFATVNIHPKAGTDSLLVVLHLGAKAHGGVVPRPAIPDPEGLLEWRGKDRAVLRLGSLKEVKAAKAPPSGHRPGLDHPPLDGPATAAPGGPAPRGGPLPPTPASG